MSCILAASWSTVLAPEYKRQDGGESGLCTAVQELPTCSRSSDKLVMIYTHLVAHSSRSTD